jgi:anaerobic magnesium-protoporphyrin IX monomethyl ester cyclase
VKLVLVFPPPASPTYVPIGIASLAAFVRRQLPGCVVRLLDLNLDAWERLAAASSGGPGLLRFLRGVDGGFFDPVRYAEAQRPWQELRRELATLGEQARRCAGGGAPEPSLAALLEAQVELVLGTEPDVVGLSLLYPEQAVFGVALARHLRRRAPTLRIIAGGAALSALRSDELLRACPELDALLLGEGEPGLAQWLAGAPGEEVAGLARRGPAGRIERNAHGAAISLEELPAPDFAGLPLERYLSPEPVLPALYSRGCSWRRCRFCAHNASLGRHRRKRAAAFVDELFALQAATSVRHVYLADQNVEAEALDALASEILARGLELSFHVMARPTPEFTGERLARAAAAGCRWISWGVESGSQRLLDGARKGTRAKHIPAVIGAARAAGISNLAMLVFGLPGSTEEDLAETMRLLETLFPDLDAVTASSFVLFDGTAFGRRPSSHGLVSLGNQVLFGAGDGAVRSFRQELAERGQHGEVRPPRGPLEVSAWEQRRRWLGELRFDHLCVEHYLLYAARR